ncbi:LPS assembly lipoprotein LptE [Bowmanella sp. JS7-9]|uniref:LPS-assembly lipoprotein LptE n=1 Tax=Pseudobowmanella zhangzhouensis TaxID=1537679 RepID=A0ABW1XKW4_9ALTE|nr:LPS assembly lipoprotein LptE [Bowmanella sp. JS7-9]TBX27387.1 hypothetical protein TK45_01150 [Bowmanella sp. JS7-9]
MRNLMRNLLLIVSLLTLTACGFHLRGSQPIPLNLQTLWLTSQDHQDPLFAVLKKRMARHEITLLEQGDEQHAQLLVNDGAVSRRLLSLFPSGQVAEYELIYTVRWSLWRPGDDSAEWFEFDILREYQDDPDQVLAKSRETALIMQEMRQQAAERIMSTLATQTR